MMPNLPPYNQRLCAKCGGAEATTRYCVGLPEDLVDTRRVIASRGLSSTDQCTVRGEHHHRVCQTCGYAWEEAVWEEPSEPAPASAAPDHQTCAVDACAEPATRVLVWWPYTGDTARPRTVKMCVRHVQEAQIASRHTFVVEEDRYA